LSMALDLVEKEGRILLSTNCSSLKDRALEVLARYCLKSSRRTASYHREPPLLDFPPRTGATTLWLTLH
jgi:hypothetical protein